jgi:cell division inhibitor SulA
MHKYIIERELPAIGSAERQTLKEAAQKSNAVLKELGPDIQWVESYVAGDKTFCVYLAQNEEIIHEHSRRSGFPANKVTEVRRMIDPTTATEA